MPGGTSEGEGRGPGADAAGGGLDDGVVEHGLHRDAEVPELERPPGPGGGGEDPPTTRIKKRTTSTLCA